MSEGGHKSRNSRLPAHRFIHRVNTYRPQSPGVRYSAVLAAQPERRENPIRLAAAITPITIDDLDVVADLLRLTLTESGVDPGVVTDRYAASWMQGGRAVFGARIGRCLVGYAILEPHEGPSNTVALSVLERYRRQGLGEKLMRALLDEIRRVGEIGEVWLSVAPDNLPARALYEKLNFVTRTDAPSGLFAPAGYLTMLWRPDR